MLAHQIEAAEDGTSDYERTTLATEILPRSRKSSSGVGDSGSGNRSSSRYSRHALKRRILLISPTVTKIKEIRGWVSMGR